MNTQTFRFRQAASPRYASNLKRYLLLPSLLLLFFQFFTFNPLSAQMSFPTSCPCLNFVYACSGQPALELENALVKVYCGESVDNYYISLQGEATTEPTAELCSGHDSWPTCNEGRLGICLAEKNWEICSIVGCTVYVEETLDVEPTINGTMLGYGEYQVPCQSSTNTCYGRLYQGCLNTLAGATDILACPGDDMILHFDDLVIPSASGMCLFVTIKTAAGVPIAGHSASYPSGKVTGGSVDITDLLDGLDTDDYIIDMELNCCTGDSPTCFMTNNHYYAYIHLKGRFGFEPIAGSGYSPNNFLFDPATSAPGSVLGAPKLVTVGPFSFYQNYASFIGNNVVNPDNVTVYYDWVDTNCNSTDTDDQSVDAGTAAFLPPPNDDIFTIPNLDIYTVNATDCKCYRLDITYNNSCDVADVVESYYFRTGASCFAGPSDPPADKIKSGNGGGKNFDIGIQPNPVGDGPLMFEWEGAWPNEGAIPMLVIQNSSGQVMVTEPINFDGRQAKVNFNGTSGLYFYSVLLNGQTYSGKFIKQ